MNMRSCNRAKKLAGMGLAAQGQRLLNLLGIWCCFLFVIESGYKVKGLPSFLL